MSGPHIPDPGFAGDTGEADPALTAALAAYRDDPAAEAEVLAALARSRLLAPVVAVLAEEGEPVGEPRTESSTDMALAVLVGADGRRGLPAFTSTGALARWDPSARPVPMTAATAAQAAAAEQADVLVVDVAGPVTYVCEGPPLGALAEGRPMRPLYDDTEVRSAVAGVLAGTPEVLAGWLVPVAGADARLEVRVAVDDPDAAERVGTALASTLAGVAPLQAAVLRGVDLALVPAGGETRPDPLFTRT